MNAYKAWVDYGEGSTVVFAETRNQAKVIALSCDCCEDAKYTDIRVHRMKRTRPPVPREIGNGLVR